MFKNIKTIKLYYSLAKVKPLLLLLMFLTLIIPATLSILTPILISNAITAITVYDFKLAKQKITYEFLVLIISTISYFCYHFINSKCNKIIINNYQTYIYNNVKENKNLEGINLNTLKNISTCAEFNKNLIYKFCFFIKAIIILIIIFNYNKIISLILIAISIISYILLSTIDKHIQYNSKQLSNYEMQSLNLFNSICKGQKIEQNFNLNETLKDKYFEYVNQNIKTTNKISLFYNINNNFISLILKLTTFLATIYLIGLVETTKITLSIYLILTPYLTSSAENLISFFDIFPEIALVDNILQEFSSLKYIYKQPIEKPIEIKSYNLYFYQTYAEFNETKIENINAKLEYNSIVCFESKDKNKLKLIYDLIAQNIKPISGGIFLDGKNISDIELQVYKKYISSVSKQDSFFHISIYENLYLVCPNRQKILSTIKTLHLNEYINSLPNATQTIYNEKINEKITFILSLLRAYLSGSKIINILDLPDDLTNQDLEKINFIIKSIKKDSLIILYYNQQIFNNIIDQKILLE